MSARTKSAAPERNRGSATTNRRSPDPGLSRAFQIRALPEIGLTAMLLVLLISAAVELVRRNWVRPATPAVEAPSIAAVRLDAPEAAQPGGDRSWMGTKRKSSKTPSPEAPFATLDSMLGDHSPEAEDSFREKIRNWAETDPAAAAAWTTGLKDGPARANALEQVAIAWADVDLAAAAQWLHSLPADHSQPHAVLAFAYEAARTDPRAALREARELDPTPERDQALLHAVSQWSASDDAAALAWSMQVSDPALRAQLVSSVAIAAAEASPAAAAKLTALALEPGVEQDDTAVSVVQRWGQSDPRAAADWVLQFPDTPARLAAMQNLASIWAGSDPAGLEKWASALPPGPMQDTALAASNEAVGAEQETDPRVATPPGGG